MNKKLILSEVHDAYDNNDDRGGTGDYPGKEYLNDKKVVSVKAYLHQNIKFNHLSAQCPYCHEDSYELTGNHNLHGIKVVGCYQCNGCYRITW